MPPNFLKDYSTTEQLTDSGQEVDEGDVRTIVDLLSDQIDFADVILVNKTDLITPDELHLVHGMIRALNAKAVIFDTINSEIPIDEVLGTGRYDPERASQHDGWLESLIEHTPETEEYGITNFVYERRIPFHPQRFFDFLQKDWPGVIRSKGIFWLATRLKMSGVWSRAGSISRHECGGYFGQHSPAVIGPKTAVISNGYGNPVTEIADRRSSCSVVIWIRRLLFPCLMNVSLQKLSYPVMRLPGLCVLMTHFLNGIQGSK